MNKITNDDLINSLSKQRQAKINAEVEHNIAKWGGVRENSGRKPISGKVLKYTKRVTAEEAKFIDYARKHNINYSDLMEG